MPYAVCINCRRQLTRPGHRGVRLVNLCCPLCGGAIRGARTPIEIARLDAPYPELTELYRNMPRAVERWLYEARKDDAAWVRAMSGSVEVL